MEIDIKDLESQLAAATDNKDKVDALNSLIDVLLTTDLHRALELSKAAIELATTGQFAKDIYKQGYAASLRNRGAAYFFLGSFTKAVRDANSALALFEETEDSYGLSRTFGLFAGIHRRIGEFPSAVSYNLKAAQLAQKLGDSFLEARTLNQLGAIYDNLGDYHKALETYKRSLEINEDNGFTRDVATNLNNMAVAERYLKNTQTALEHAQRSLQINQEIDSLPGQAYSLSTLGEIYMEMGDHQTALQHFQESIAITTELGIRPLEMVTRLILGNLHSSLEEDAPAIEYLDKALAIANELEAKPEMYQCHQALAKIFTRQGKDAIALHHFEKFFTIKEEVINQDVAIKVEGLKAIHETEIARKETEIYRLKNEELEQMVAERTSELAQANANLLQAYDVTLEGWVKALELRNHDTLGHTLRVVDLTVKLATAMGVEGEELAHIRRGALLHDIGKMAIPDHILEKRGSHSEEESEIMQQHTEFAVQMLSPIDFLGPAMDIPKYHHEKWDGSGYPNSFKGEKIPLAARIFAVVDVWDALLSDRPYRKAWSKKKSLDHIRQEAGASFDPKVVDVFMEVIS